MSETLKFCKDCRHCAPDFNDLEFARCQHPLNYAEQPDYVRGGVIRDYIVKYASTQRSSALENRCGPEARWFEPREQAEAAQ